jgi:uncharacterized protein YcbX
MSTENIAGSVLSVLRYPVKSMMGEELTVADVMEGGLIGDRAYALIDNGTGKIASAKNPRKWAHGCLTAMPLHRSPAQRSSHASGMDHAAGWRNIRSDQQNTNAMPAMTSQRHFKL